MDFKKFKAQRKKGAAVAQKMMDQKPSWIDDRFWSLTKDNNANGEAIIRLLCAVDPDGQPYVKRFTHGIKGNGKYFFENCPVTIGGQCPSCDYAQPYWDEDTEESKKVAFKYWRKKEYIFNILIVNDVAKPENNGKVFLWKCGQKLFDKILAKVKPKSKLDKPIWVFDLWDGLNFKISSCKRGGFVNYDDSQFYAERTPVAETDEEIEAIYKQIRLLDEFVAPDQFKDYETLRKKFNKIVSDGVQSRKPVIVDDEINANNAKEVTFDDSGDTPTVDETPTETPTESVDENSTVDETPTETVTETPKVETKTDDVSFDDDDFDFSNLSDDDFDFEG